MIPYTYVIVNNVTHQKYYGARWSKDCHPNDLWVTYFTSSKHVKRLIKMYGADSFTAQVRRVFTDVATCKDWEQRVLRRLKVTTNEMWLNKNINGKFLPYGRQSPEHVAKRIAKLCEYNKRHSRVLSEETKRKISATSKGKPKPMTDEHKQNLKCHSNNSTQVTCPHCGKIGQLTNMKRWHFDRCKKNPNRVSDLDGKLIICSKCGHTAKSSANFFRYHEDNCSHVHNV